MDELYVQSLVLAAVAVALLQVLRVALNPVRERAPPGPWKLPVIGSMHHLMNVLPHRALRDLACAHGPLMMLQLGQTPLLVVSSRETARLVLRTHDANFATRPKILAAEILTYQSSDILFSPTGDYWRKLRQLCAAEILGPKRVLSFRYIREDEVRMRVDQIRQAGPSKPVNLSVMFHGLTNSIIARAAFGKTPKKSPEFLAAVTSGVRLASGFDIPDLFPEWTTVLAALTGMKRRLQGVHKTVDAFLEEMINERNAARADKIKVGGTEKVDENLIDVLIGLQEGGGLGFELDNSRIKAVILDMFAAGTGTAGSSMEWGMSELMRNPLVMKKLQGQIREEFKGKAVVTEADLQESNLRYLKLVIKEALRLHPPGPLLVPRESIGSCELQGYTVPAKSRVVINVWAIGRDPAYWKDAEEFQPERFEDGAVDFTGNNFEFVPFGAGRRMCPGINYAIAVMELALVGLLYHFDWSLPEGVCEVDMEEARGLGVRRRTPLMLIATPFVPAALA
ncbi:unnamed protein product [Triticum turgidum subsp. durum]|uniref:Cytochrome P450 n=1 Tax=Triticum turgidum subsp. durum TaxID=4567 RepID=A0A9R0Z0F4_TRITD|nr:unnamed protein product [Triticum turgidum subsp. durum]